MFHYIRPAVETQQARGLVTTFLASISRPITVKTCIHYGATIIGELMLWQVGYFIVHAHLFDLGGSRIRFLCPDSLIAFFVTSRHSLQIIKLYDHL